MNPFRAIIADDEEALRHYLRARLNEVWPELDICAQATNGLEALRLIETFKPRIAFLDIRMPGLTGLEIGRKISGTWVVFVTAYEEYAVQAFETEAVDYLLKPVTNERLIETVRRLKDKISRSPLPPEESTLAIERALSAIAQPARPEYLRWIRAGHGDGVRLIPVEEIIYFKAGDKYTTIVSEQGESLIKTAIKELTGQLDPDLFWPIHRSTIVNVRFIKSVQRSLSGGLIRLKTRSETLRVSRTYIHLFKQM